MKDDSPEDPPLAEIQARFRAGKETKGDAAALIRHVMPNLVLVAAKNRRIMPHKWAELSDSGIVDSFFGAKWDKIEPVLRAFPAEGKNDNIKGELAKMMRNWMIDQMRPERRHPTVSANNLGYAKLEAMSGRAAVSDPPPSLDVDHLADKLRDLPPSDREALKSLLRYHEGHETLEEMARAKGKSRDALKAGHERGKAGLRARMGNGEGWVDFTGHEFVQALHAAGLSSESDKADDGISRTKGGSEPRGR